MSAEQEEIRNFYLIVDKDNIDDFANRYHSIDGFIILLMKNLNFSLGDKHTDEIIEYKNEIVCVICCLMYKENIYNYMIKTYKINYDIMMDLLLQCNTYLKNNMLIKDVIGKVELRNDDNFIKLMIKNNIDDERALNHCMNLEDRSMFNEIILDKTLDEKQTLFCLQFVKDEDIIDNVLLMFNQKGETFDNLHDVNRQFNVDYFTRSYRYPGFIDIRKINEYGLLIYSLMDPNFKYKIDVLLNKGVLLKVVETKDMNMKIDIESLKLIEDCENFHDFISLNRCFLMNCTKTNEEVDYLIRLL